MILKFDKILDNDYDAFSEFVDYSYGLSIVINTKNIVSIETYWRPLENICNGTKSDYTECGLVINGHHIIFAIASDEVTEDGKDDYSSLALKKIYTIYEQIVEAMEKDI